MRAPVVDKCSGCLNILIPENGIGEYYCSRYLWPEAKWSTGNCPMNTHIKKAAEEQKKALDPIKQSKRAMKGK